MHQLSSFTELHCHCLIKSLAAAGLPEYVATHSHLTGYLRPWELDSREQFQTHQRPEFIHEWTHRDTVELRPLFWSTATDMPRMFQSRTLLCQDKRVPLLWTHD